MNISKNMITSSGIITALSLLVLVAGCTKDRNLNDYKNDQLQQDLTKLASANGVYSGLAISEQDNKTQLGALQLSLQATTQPLNSTDQTKASAQPVLVTNVDFLGAQRMSIAAQNSFYEPTSGVYQSQIQVARIINGTTTTVTVSLNAVLNNSNGTLDGTIEAAGFPGFGARFHLIRGGSSLDQLAAQSTSNPNAVFSQQNFSGATVFTNPVDGVVSKPVNMNILKAPSTAEEDFLTVLVPQRPVIVNLNYGDAAQIEFQNGLWDIRTGRVTGTASLTATTTNTGGGTAPIAAPQTIVLSLECDYNSGNQGFKCKFKTTSSTTVAATADLHPDPNAVSDPVDNTATRDAIVYNYKGKMTVNNLDPEHPGVTHPVTYNINFTTIWAARTRLQEVTELFEPVTEKILQVSFAVVGSGIGDNFVATKWDFNNHTLDGNATFTTPGGVTGNSYIKCTSFTFQDPKVVRNYNFTCDWLSSLTGENVPLIIHN